MTLSIAFASLFAALFGPEPPRPNRADLVPGLDSVLGRMHQDIQQRTRRGIALLEGNIELFERLANEGVGYVSPARLSELRAEVEKMKKLHGRLILNSLKRRLYPSPENDWRALQELQQLLDELWPPEPLRAPMPREVKR